jgi:hypothetical protein
MRYRLEHDVPIRRTEAGPTQGREAQRVRRIVREVEPALDRQVPVLGIADLRVAMQLARSRQVLK